ncbi:hypothetical protein OVN20_09125 [Microcella daejeonensis]|uniref:hypothetical protein n=1 Tax=Microcella daejeonensis TaxID=2994971 RepID=UPI00226E4027|nr:hypothetical protein [Microcella daejeonensis]WAB83244.1 hypothetical protein OVN20_09125 [Microcella daejeonensis]
MTAAGTPAPAPADPPAPAAPIGPAAPAAPANAGTAPGAVRIIVLTVPRRRGDLAIALPWFLGRAFRR